VEEGYGGGTENSGEDEESDNEGDVGKHALHGEDVEAEGGRSMCEQETKGGNVLLTCEKSTNVPDTIEEIPYFDPANVGGVETAICQKVAVTSVPLSTFESDKCVVGGVQVEEERDEVSVVREGVLHVTKEVGVVVRQVDFVRSDPGPFVTGPDPSLPGLAEVGFHLPISIPFGPNPEGSVSRYSTLSEPEEVFQTHRSRVQSRGAKSNRQKSLPKFPQLGVPKCLQLVEALQDGGGQARRRRGKAYGGAKAGEASKGVAVNSTPSSGLNLISEDVNSMVSGPQLLEQNEERVKVLEAARLLKTQKEVGFTFEMEDEDIIRELVVKENDDRAKMMDGEQKVD
jgi:hypothetical protein